MAEIVEKSYKKENIFVRFGRGFVRFFTKSIASFWVANMDVVDSVLNAVSLNLPVTASKLDIDHQPFAPVGREGLSV